MDIILKGGPADGETYRAGEACGVFTRYGKSPNSRYRNIYADDSTGRCIFEHWPLKPGEAEQREGVHHADVPALRSGGTNTTSDQVPPTIVADTGGSAAFVWEEYFTSGIRNSHTRRAYSHAVRTLISPCRRLHPRLETPLFGTCSNPQTSEVALLT